MPLINLTTNLKSLPYGSDRRGGGNSGQPFVQTPIPPQDQQSTETLPNVPLAAVPTEVANAIGIGNPFTTNVSLGAGDGIIRGGITTAASRAYIDAGRISRFLSSTEGGLFLDKQKLLSNVGPLTQGGGKFNNDLETKRLTIEGQTAGNAFGLHLLKQTETQEFNFVNPAQSVEEILENGLNFMAGTKGEPTPGRYLDNVDPFGRRANTLSLNDNRLVALSRLFNQFYLSDDEKLTGTQRIGNNGLITLNEGGAMISYPAGPGTEGLGAGTTNIRFSDQRTGENNATLLNSGFYGEGFGGTLQGDTFNLIRLARQGASVIQGGLTRLGRRRGFVGFLGNALAATVPSLYDKGVEKLDRFIRSNLANALGLENLTPQSNYSVFTRPTPTFNYTNYLGVSNIFGAIESDPLFFNNEKNHIEQDGNRTRTFDFNVYANQGIGDISKMNPELQNKNNGASWTQKNILEAPGFITVGTVGEDFRKTILEERGDFEPFRRTTISAAPSYVSNKAFETRVNAGDPGKVPLTPQFKGVFDYSVDSTKLEALNKITAFEPKNTSGKRPSRDTNPVNDFIQFNFAVINTSTSNTTYVHFPAFINAFSDNYSADWSSVRYVGRGDSFYNYEGFERSINIGFTVAAQSKAELNPMYRKLNYLASTLAPSYQSSGFMRGNLIKMTMGWYLYDVPGFFQSFNITVPEDSPYEINVSGGTFNESSQKYNDDDSVGELPLVINVDATFIPIHNFLVSKVANSEGKYPSSGAGSNNSKFISLTDGATDLYNKRSTFDANDPIALPVGIDADRDGIPDFVDVDTTNPPPSLGGSTFIGPLLPE